MIDIVQIADALLEAATPITDQQIVETVREMAARPCRVPLYPTTSEPAQCIGRANPSFDIQCAICDSTDLVWAFKLEHPDFKSGAIACQKCGQVYDVTPRE